MRRIDCVSYVDLRRIPGMADAEAVAKAIRKRPGVVYTGLWLNMRGFERARRLPLDLRGNIRIIASDTFSRRNTGMSIEQTIAEQRLWLAAYREHGLPIDWGHVMTAFGCNYEGEVPIDKVLDMCRRLLDRAAEAGVTLKGLYLADTVGWATPLSVERRVGAMRSQWPGSADMVAFGRLFISNPDLSERFRRSASLATHNRETLYTDGPVVYVDYPAMKGGLG